jgi:hypothetical protein
LTPTLACARLEREESTVPQSAPQTATWFSFECSRFGGCPFATVVDVRMDINAEGRLPLDADGKDIPSLGPCRCGSTDWHFGSQWPADEAGFGSHADFEALKQALAEQPDWIGFMLMADRIVELVSDHESEAVQEVVAAYLAERKRQRGY